MNRLTTSNVVDPRFVGHGRDSKEDASNGRRRMEELKTPVQSLRRGFVRPQLRSQGKCIEQEEEGGVGHQYSRGYVCS